MTIKKQMKLTEKWLPVAYEMTQGWEVPGYTQEDLQQEARMVIHKCAGLWNKKKSCFHTFLRNCIKNHLITLIQKNECKKRKNNGIISMDTPMEEDENANLHDVLADTSRGNVMNLREMLMDRSAAIGDGVGESVFEEIDEEEIRCIFHVMDLSRLSPQRFRERSEGYDISEEAIQAVERIMPYRRPTRDYSKANSLSM